MREKTYIVKPEEKVVVATMCVTQDRIEDEVTTKCTKSTMYAVLDMLTNTYDLKIPDLEISYKTIYKGVSKCDSYDEFDERKGKDIARNKADMKYHIAMMKKYKRLKDIFAKAFDEMYRLEMEHLNKVDNIKESLQKYSVEQEV